MATSYFDEALKLLNKIKQQSIITMECLQFRKADVDEVADMHRETIECCKKIHSDIEIKKQFLADAIERFQEELQSQAKLLQIPFEEGFMKSEKEVSTTVKSNEKLNTTEVVTRRLIKNEPIKHDEHSDREVHSKLKTVPHIQDVTAKELLSVRKLGKLSLPELNAIICEINRLLKEKYDILRRNRHNLNKYDIKRTLDWISQLDKNPDLKERFLITEAETVACLAPKLKVQLRIARLCLAALNRVEIFQRDEHVYFVTL